MAHQTEVAYGKQGSASNPVDRLKMRIVHSAVGKQGKIQRQKGGPNGKCAGP